MSSLFKIDLNVDKEYIPLINDLLRMGVIHIVTQLLLNISSNETFDMQFVQTIFYVLLSICIYWLIIRKIIIIE